MELMDVDNDLVLDYAYVKSAALQRGIAVDQRRDSGRKHRGQLRNVGYLGNGDAEGDGGRQEKALSTSVGVVWG